MSLLVITIGLIRIQRVYGPFSIAARAMALGELCLIEKQPLSTSVGTELRIIIHESLMHP
jgi:hypothetical protein